MICGRNQKMSCPRKNESFFFGPIYATDSIRNGFIHSPASISLMAEQTLVMKKGTEERLAAEIRAGGLEAFSKKIMSDAGFRELQIAINLPKVKSAISEAIRSEGKRLLDYSLENKIKDPIKQQFDTPFKPLLADPEGRDRLKQLLVTDTGRDIMRSSVSTREGEFYVIGIMFNLPGGMPMVVSMLPSEQGRMTAATIVASACKTSPDPFFVPQLPPVKKTEFGNGFSKKLSTDKGVTQLIKELETIEGRVAYRSFFLAQETEARSVLRDALSTPEGVERVAQVMVSESGRTFLGMLGANDVGMKIAGDDLWLLPGGRQLVAKLLQSPQGEEAVLGLVTGFSVGTSLLHVLPLRQELGRK